MCIEQRANAPALPIAKRLRIPVIIDSASTQGGLHRAGIKSPHAIVAAGSDERDNIAIAIAARAAAPNINVVLRAGSDDAIDETRSLFRVGRAVDVNALTSLYVAVAVIAEPPYLTTHANQEVVALDKQGTIVDSGTENSIWCTCA